jgi:hypothetical protein
MKTPQRTRIYPDQVVCHRFEASDVVILDTKRLTGRRHVLHPSQLMAGA